MPQKRIKWAVIRGVPSRFHQILFSRLLARQFLSATPVKQFETNKPQAFSSFFVKFHQVLISHAVETQNLASLLLPLRIERIKWDTIRGVAIVLHRILLSLDNFLLPLRLNNSISTSRNPFLYQVLLSIMLQNIVKLKDHAFLNCLASFVLPKFLKTHVKSGTVCNALRQLNGGILIIPS